MTAVQIVLLIFTLGLLLILLIILVVFLRFFRLWIKAFLAEVPVSVFSLIGMTLRKCNASRIIDQLIVARIGGVEVTALEMEKAYLQGVDIEKVTLAAIAAKRKNLDLKFPELVETELAGRLAEKLGLR